MLSFGAEFFVFQFPIKNLKIKIYRTKIFPLVLYGCQTWSLTLREERRLRVSENRLQRRIFGPNKDEVTGEWKKLNNDDFNWSHPDVFHLILRYVKNTTNCLLLNI